MRTHLINHKGETTFSVGDEVENADARFFIGSINESQQLCAIDKSKPFSTKRNSQMRRCIEQGNYAASALTLSQVQDCPDCEGDGCVECDGTEHRSK